MRSGAPQACRETSDAFVWGPGIFCGTSFAAPSFYGSIPGLGLHPAGSGLPNSLNAPIVGMVPSGLLHGRLRRRRLRLLVTPSSPAAAGHWRVLGRSGGRHARCQWQWLLAGHRHWQYLHLRRRPLLWRSWSADLADHLGGGHPGRQGLGILDGDGQVFAYGDAANLGNVATGATGGLNPATAIFATSDGGGYWVADALARSSPSATPPITATCPARTSTGRSSQRAVRSECRRYTVLAMEPSVRSRKFDILRLHNPVHELERIRFDVGTGTASLPRSEHCRWIVRHAVDKPQSPGRCVA